MKFNFKKNHNNVRVGDIVFNHTNGYTYMIVREFICQSYRYSLLCLNDVCLTGYSFECIDDIIDHHFEKGKYDVIPGGDLVLSN